MRSLALAILLALATAGVATAQTAKPAPAPAAAAEPPPTPPRAFQPAYSQPDISPGLCQVKSPKQTECVIPEMTAGRYLIVGIGTSTANAAGAVQGLTIFVGGAPCVAGRSNKPWSSGVQSIRLGCFVTVLTDHPLPVVAAYEDLHATPAAKGPALLFRRMPWNGVLNSAPVPVQQQ